jgi:hypothetical protein
MPSGGGGERWKDRKILAGAVGATISALPVACSVGAALLFQRLVYQPATVVLFGLWWLGMLSCCAIVFLALELVARRVLPLAVLLKMGMAFPGRAPRRLAVARRAASVRDLSRRVEEARAHGLADQPTEAAERIVILAASLSAHDPTTRGHAERVRALTDMIAEELHLTSDHRDRLRWSSLLHDIGKLTVHPDVLNKDGNPSDAEWEILRRHPLEGAQLTAPIAGWLGEWSNTIAEHHERFDGAGYPYGLAGRRISLGGRIVAVADSYDVMTSPRSYRKPMSPEKARQELAACAGSQFDPDIVRAFLAVSIWRLRLIAPLSWLGSLASPKVASAAARFGAVTGHSAIAGVVAGFGVLGMTAAAPLLSTSPAPVASAISTTPPVHGESHAGIVASSGHGRSGGNAVTTTTGGSATATNNPPTSSFKAGSTTTTSALRTTTTVATTTPTTKPPPPTTTTKPPPPTTTTEQPPPPSAPADVDADGGCQQGNGPEMLVTWQADPGGTVSSYTVLRNNGSAFVAIAQVSASTTSYADTAVSGDDTYTYEVEATGPGGNATSPPATGSTPDHCQ